MINKKEKNKIISGFTAIETIIVMAIFGIIASVIIPNLVSTRNKNLLEDAQANLLYALEKARNQSLNGVGENRGICIKNNNTIILFEGSNCDDLVIETFQLPVGAVFSPEQINKPILFNRINGQIKDQNGPITNSINISVEVSGQPPKTITITPDGRIITQ